jgi:hypothetical protein
LRLIANWRCAVTAAKDTLDSWGAALEHGDDVEVDRLVRQSRADRNGLATSGQRGTMLGQVAPSVSDEVAG